MKETTKENQKQIKFLELFRFATKIEKTILIFSLIISFLNGLVMPAFAFLMGEMIDSFSPRSTAQDVVDLQATLSIEMSVLGGFNLFAYWFSITVWSIIGERQSIRYRKIYFQAVLRQDIAWFDSINANELSTKISLDCNSILEAITDKVPTFITTIFQLIASFAVAFTKGWKLALVVMCALPVMGAFMTFVLKHLQTKAKRTEDTYAEAGGLAEQALNAIKTVKSLTGESYEAKKYETTLTKAWAVSVHYAIKLGIGVGGIFLIQFWNYALSFWYGSKLIGDHEPNDIFDRQYRAGDIMTVFFAVIIGGFSLGQITPCLSSFALGKQAGNKIFSVIDRTPLVQDAPNAIAPQSIEGHVEFKNVEFTYPIKADQKILKKVNLVFECNKKTAMVGESGSGKSTVMQLLERFYDPQEGSIEIDGQNLRNLKLDWLRNNIGYVGQEPVLFQGSIKENLRFGKPSATDEDMIEALKQANAWQFVSQLEKKMDTQVGHAGSQFSGGQRQRICIARAILKNPKILLLDEATSALDRKNERQIQETLDRVSQGRTTIVIAHRLSTIQNSDRIYVLDHGNLIETGNHDELINKGGKYEALAKNQLQMEKEEEERQRQEQEKQNKKKLVQQNISDQLETDAIDINLKSKPQINDDAKHLDDDQYLNEIKEIQERERKQKEQEEYEKKQQQLKIQQQIEREKKPVWSRLLKLSIKEWYWYLTGILGSCMYGVAYPLISLFLAKMIVKLNIPQAKDFREKCDEYALGFFLIGILAFVGRFIYYNSFIRVAESLSMRLRVMSFQKMLAMPIYWFDQPQNNPGTLSAKLATDAQQINNAASNVVGIIASNIANIIAGLIIGFLHSVPLSLITLALSPIVAASGILRGKRVRMFQRKNDEAYIASSFLITETVTNIRTVTSFSNQQYFFSLMDEKLQAAESQVMSKGHVAGLCYGGSNCLTMNFNSIIFYIGAIFLRDHGLSTDDMFTSTFAIMYSAMSIGESTTMLADVGLAKNAAQNIFEVLDAKDEFQIQKESNIKIDNIPFRGNIEFKNVNFKYPTREKQVLQDLSFKVQSGQKVAFVGTSGCGKSTIQQLLLRFYEHEGEILIEGKDIRSYEIGFLRQQFGVVSQEPTLFLGSIRDNIAYNQSNLPLEQIRNAAQSANALTFIEQSIDQKQNNNPNELTIQIQKDVEPQKGEGFDRQVGLKGSHLSGGQKQRVAIARAIIREPRIMLLDEATSALDTENEQIVQTSLNQIMKGKTSLVIAHRISTIVDSDQILVMENGKILEQGTYKELVAKQSYFYRLERGEN